MAKASDNVFPYVHLSPAVAPSSPSSGSQRLYLDSADGNKLKRKDSAGTVTTIEGGGGSALTVQDENSNISTSVGQIDFQGAGVTVTSGTGEVIVTIPGGSTPGAWTSYTPVLTAATTNPTIGTGGNVVEGYYSQNGKTVTGWFGIQFGSSGNTAGSGEWRVSLPVTAVSTGTTVPIGTASGFNPTGSFSILRQSTTTMKFWNNGSYVGSSTSGAGSSGSQIWGTFTYEAA